MKYNYLKYVFLCVFVLFFMFVFVGKVDGLNVDKIDINQDSDFYVSLDKTWSLLELKIELNAVKNGKSGLDIFHKLENILVDKIINNNSKVDKNNENLLILLYFVQESIDNLQVDVLGKESIYKTKTLDEMFDNLYQESDEIYNQNTRGIWFWSNKESDWGLFNVIGNSDKEEEVIGDLKKYNIARVYSSYGRSLSVDKNAVRERNIKLHDEGIKSDLLIGSSFLSIINDKEGFLETIQECFLDFNKSSSKKEKFDDIHLDIEPHAMDNRGDLSLTEKKGYLYELLDLYKDLREYLDDNNGEYADIYADLPHWFSKVSSLGWDDEQERDDWFLEVGEVVEGITLMTYENTKLDTIVRWAEEETVLLGDKIKLSLDIDIGEDETWSSVDEYFEMIKNIENNTNYTVDIHHYGDLK